MFGSLENKGKRREKREKQNLIRNIRLYLQRKENLQKLFSPKLLLRVTKREGLILATSIHENTKKPINLAKFRDKRVIHEI